MSRSDRDEQVLRLEGAPKRSLVRAMTLLDGFLTNDERGNLRMGGGTTLAMRWGHRTSTDVDLAVDEGGLPTTRLDQRYTRGSLADCGFLPKTRRNGRSSVRVSKLCVSKLWNRFEVCFGPSGSGIAVTATIMFCSLVSGCATNPDAAVPPPPSMDDYALVGADVTVGEGAWTGRFGRLDGMDEVEFAKRVEEELESALVEAVADSLNGERPARIVAHVDEMNIATGVGKALLFKRSRLGGVVRVVDTDTEETLAEARLSARERLRAPLESDSLFDVSASPGGPAAVGGAWVELADHIAEDRVVHIAREFAWRVRVWLNSGRLQEQQPSAEQPVAPDANGRSGPISGRTETSPKEP